MSNKTQYNKIIILPDECNVCPFAVHDECAVCPYGSESGSDNNSSFIRFCSLHQKKMTPLICFDEELHYICRPKWCNVKSVTVNIGWIK